MKHVLIGLVVVAVFFGCSTTLSRTELAVEYYNLGTAYYELENLEKSADYLARALELDPSLARASYNLARVYLLKGENERALELLGSLLETDPQNVLVIESLGYATYLTGDPQGAAALYDRAMEINPADTDLIRNRAQLAIAADDQNLAAALFRRALEVTPDDTDLTLLLARAEAAGSDPEAALTTFKTYLIGRTDDGSARFEYAELLSSLEFYSEALEQLLVVANDGTAPELQARAYFRQAFILLTAAQESDAGLSALRSAVDLGFTDSEAVATLLADPQLISRDEVTKMLADGGVGADASRESGQPATDEGTSNPLSEAPSTP